MIDSATSPVALVPTLTSERLILRGHRREDLSEATAMWADANVTRHIGGRPFSEEEVWGKLLRHVGHWAVTGFGYWVVRERDTGVFVGEAGFADFRRELDPPLGGAPEVGWALAAHAHGKGYATEAVQRALQWSDARFGNAKTVCLIAPANVASARVADKCGYRLARRTTYKHEAIDLYERGAAGEDLRRTGVKGG